MKNQNLIKLVGGALKSPLKLDAWSVKIPILPAILFSAIFLFCMGPLQAQYVVDFEGTGEEKGSYGSGTVTLSGLEWNMTEALIGTLANDWKNGVRSARLRGYGTSSMTMLENKSGVGTISFSYSRYGSDSQIAWKLEYSTNDGATWTQLGSDFTGDASVQTFSEALDVPDDARIRISSVPTTGTSNNRLNVDDITLTDYVPTSSPEISVSETAINDLNYAEGSGPSAPQSFTVSGTDLTGNVSFSTGTNFEFSYDGVNFSNTLFSLPQAGGTLPATQVFVRLEAGLSSGDYNETLTISSPGASDVTLSLNGTVAGLPQGLIISQYIETNSGTTPKGIELWNQSGSTIDFSVDNLVILKGTNGSPLSPDVTVNTGTLADGDVMVIGTTDMGTYLTNQGLGSVMFVDFGFTFNGDDALSVELGGVTEDTFGTPGVDPGSSWSGGGVSTANENIALLCDITTGEPAGWSDPSLRFSTVAAGIDLTGFGVAPQQCGGSTCSIDNVSFANVSACDPVDNSFTVDISVEYTNDPGGNLVINGEVFAVTSSPQTETITLDSDGNDVDVEVSFALDPTCESSNPALFMAPASCQASNEQGLIISQYIETNSGTTPKGIELWNQSGSTIDFSVDNLVILKGTNGSPLSPDVTVNTGTLADGDVMVIGTTDMGTYLTNEGLGSVLFVDYGFTFNGDDALSVELGGVTEDTFGTPGVDPGSSWSGGGVSTANENIALLCDITTGEPAGWSDPSLRFSSVGVGTDLTGFGVAPQQCGGSTCSITNVTASNLSACDIVDNSYTVDITVEYTDGPGGNMVVNGEIFAMTASPQTVQLTGDSDGSAVDVEVSFALDPACTSSNPALFTAPAPCVIPVAECGNESFSLMGTGSGSYQTISFTGDNGFTITATDARADQDINGDAITVRNGTLTVTDATGGVGSLTLTTQRVFAGGSGNLDVMVNGNSVGMIPFDATVQTTTIDNINVAGMVDILIATPGDGNRVVMDDLIWTCLDGPAIILTAISGDTDESGTTATFDVTLNTAPTNPVQLLVSSGDVGENTVSPAVLNFDNVNFDTPQTVTVTGVADGIADGDQMTDINVVVDDPNSDDDYDGLSATVSVTNIDIDACDLPVWEVISPTVSPSAFSNNGEWEVVPGGFSANGFCGGGCTENVNTWLVYGPLDMSSTTSFQLEFDATENFGTTDLVVQYSTDYEVDPCPADATWLGQMSVTAGGATSVDLSGAAGLTDVYIGIAYTDDGADGYSDWELTNFGIVADVCPAIGTPVVSDCTPPAPANNECANAQSLSVPTFPTSSNALGTLYGATNEGGLACTGNADGGDVFYAFNLANENHVGITVNPFAGADVVVEVLDACAGTSIACIDNVGAGSTESELLENLAAGSYTVRVHNAGGSPEPEGSASFLINVQQMPYAQVQDNPGSTLYACNQTGFQLEDFVGADPQTTSWVLDYEWLAAEEGGGAQTVYQRGEPNYVSRIEWLGMEYGKTYNVFVRVLINHPVFGPTWGVYQGDYQNPNLPGASACTISTASNVTPTELRPNYTPTNAQGNDYGLCDFAIAYNVQGSENFRWRFDGNGTPGDAEDIIYTRGTGNPSVRLSWVNGLLPGLTYNVAVQVQVAGQWSGYSTVLPLTMALPPNDVEIRSAFCGGTYAPNGYILSESVCDADLYQFRFTPSGGGTPSFRNSGNYVCFMSAANPALTPGDYDVQVKVTQNGVPGDWGPVCTITIAGPQSQENETPVLRDIEVMGSAMLFPNPNEGQEVRVNLDGLSDGNHEVMIQIYDVYGKLISNDGFGHEGNSFSRLVRFDGEMATGMYMVQIVVDGERFATERLIVK